MWERVEYYINAFPALATHTSYYSPSPGCYRPTTLISVLLSPTQLQTGYRNKIHSQRRNKKNILTIKIILLADEKSGVILLLKMKTGVHWGPVAPHRFGLMCVFSSKLSRRRRVKNGNDWKWSRGCTFVSRANWQTCHLSSSTKLRINKHFIKSAALWLIPLKAGYYAGPTLIHQSSYSFTWYSTAAVFMSVCLLPPSLPVCVHRLPLSYYIFLYLPLPLLFSLHFNIEESFIKGQTCVCWGALSNFPTKCFNPSRGQHVAFAAIHHLSPEREREKKKSASCSIISALLLHLRLLLTPSPPPPPSSPARVSHLGGKPRLVHIFLSQVLSPFTNESEAWAKMEGREVVVVEGGGGEGGQRGKSAKRERAKMKEMEIGVSEWVSEWVCEEEIEEERDKENGEKLTAMN